MENAVAVPEPGSILIPLLKGKFAIADTEEGEFLNQFNWYFNANGYARTTVSKGCQKYLHQLLIGASESPEVDHINGNRLDNRRSNLRPATRSQNAFNKAKSTTHPASSQYKGVGWDKSKGKWMAFARSLEKTFKFLGYFSNELDAALAYNKFASTHYGEWAVLNDL